MAISLAVSLCLIFAAVLSIELGISSAVLEILSGVMLIAFMPDIAEAKWLSYLSHLGMLALMFVAGFELQLTRFKSIWKPCAAIGVSSFLVPFLGIFLFCRYGLSFPDQKSVLIGIALSTTSLALVYHVLKEHKILGTDEGQVIFGAASVVDIISMAALAILLGNTGWGTALFAVALGVTAFGLPKFGHWVFQRYPDSLAEPELRFLMVVLVGMGFMAEAVGSIHPALVAFTLGMVMAGVLDKNEVVKDKMMSLVFSFFAPIFFLQAGTRIDLRHIDMPHLLTGCALFALAILLKYAGTALPAKLLKQRGHNFIGILFNYRLSFGIVTANVGLEQGILSEQLFSVILLAVICGAAIPAFILKKRAPPVSAS